MASSSSAKEPSLDQKYSFIPTPEKALEWCQKSLCGIKTMQDAKTKLASMWKRGMEVSYLNKHQKLSIWEWAVGPKEALGPDWSFVGMARAIMALQPPGLDASIPKQKDATLSLVFNGRDFTPLVQRSKKSVIEYIHQKVFDKPKWQENPRQFLKEWEKKRGGTEELRIPEDDALEIVRQMVATIPKTDLEKKDEKEKLKFQSLLKIKEIEKYLDMLRDLHSKQKYEQVLEKEVPEPLDNIGGDDDNEDEIDE
jgi:hypothetical protein